MEEELLIIGMGVIAMGVIAIATAANGYLRKRRALPVVVVRKYQNEEVDKEETCGDSGKKDSGADAGDDDDASTEDE